MERENSFFSEIEKGREPVRFLETGDYLRTFTSSSSILILDAFPTNPEPNPSAPQYRGQGDSGPR